MIQVNLTSLTHLTRLFLPEMVKRGTGNVLNIGSTGSFAPGPFNAVYCATKAYVLSFSEAIAEELRGTGVKVTVLCPGATETEFARRAGMGRYAHISDGGHGGKAGGGMRVSIFAEGATNRSRSGNPQQGDRCLHPVLTAVSRRKAGQVLDESGCSVMRDIRSLQSRGLPACQEHRDGTFADDGAGM